MKKITPTIINPTILIIDDNEDFREVIKMFLEEEGYPVEAASNSTEALLKIRKLEGPTIILLDRTLSDDSGELILGEHLIKELEDESTHPIITLFFSGDDREETQIEAYEAGAYGYLVKGCSIRLIRSRIRQATRFLNEIIEPNIDSLTGVINRRAALDRITRELSRAERFDTTTACIMIDVDGLKSINDIYGHSSGDNVIKSVADSIRNYLRSTDLVCRYGGDEFIVFLFGTKEEEARLFAWNISQIIKSQTVKIDNEFPIRGQVGISASVGVSILESQTIKNAIEEAIEKKLTDEDSASNRKEVLEDVLSKLLKDLIKSADVAMYLEKRKKRTLL